MTLSTLGNGDIIAISRAARSLSTVEAITGRLYMAILVVRLFGLYVIEAKRK